MAEVNRQPLTEQQLREMEPETAVRAVMEREDMPEIVAREIVQRIHEGGDTGEVDND